MEEITKGLFRRSTCFSSNRSPSPEPQKSLLARETSTPSIVDNECVRYQSVSVNFLVELFERVLAREEAPQTDLAVLTKRAKGLPKGSTVRVVDKLWFGNLQCTSPFSPAVKTIASRKLKRKPRENWTIEDVCQYVVLPACEAQNCFYLDLMEEENIGSEYQGSFVSQARKSKFGDLVNSLVNHFEKKGIPLERAFVWLDVFCANQPKLLSKDEEALSQETKEERWTQLTFGLHDAIKNFDDRLIFFNSWTDPYPIQRAWCCWEIFGAIRSGKPMQLILALGEVENFVDTMEDEDKFYLILQTLADLDLKTAKCHREADLTMIHTAVETALDDGFDELNNIITNKLRGWYIDTARTTAKSLSSESSRASDDTALLLNNAGLVLSDFDEDETALSFFNQAADLYRTISGRDSPNVANCLHNIGQVLCKQGAFEEALNCHKEALAIDIKHYGKNSQAVSNGHNNIAIVFDTQGKHEEALNFYKESLRIDVITLGPNHPELATTLGNIGTRYIDQGNYEEALKYLERALSIDRKFEKYSSSVATDLQNLAVLYDSMGIYQKALACHTEALRIEKKLFGLSPQIGVNLVNIGELYKSLNDMESAKKFYRQALDIYEAHLGREHPKTKAVRDGLKNIS